MTQPKLYEPIAKPAIHQPRSTSEDVPVIIHVGPHKTGSTWLQFTVFPKLAGITLCNEPKITHRAFLIPPYGCFCLETARGAFGNHIAKAEADGTALFISDEGLGGRAFGQKYVREITAYRLKEAFPRATILFFTREQSKLLTSLYGEYIRYGYQSSLEEFLAPGNDLIEPILDLRYYEWDRTFQLYAEIFGEDSIIAMPMELSVSDPEAMLKALNKKLVPPLTCPDGIDKHTKVRPALSGWARAAQRRINGFIPQDSRRLRNNKFLNAGTIAYWVDRITPKAARKKAAEKELAVVRERIGHRFAASNRQFSQRIGVDLQQYGYMV